MFVQVAGAPQFPVASHVETPLRAPPSAAIAHSVVPGTHTPWQEAAPPLCAHAPFTQATAAPQAPPEEHVCSPLPEHCVDPGVQEPVHTPPAQTELSQATGEPSVPVELQVSTPLPEEHCVDPGVQLPVQAPPTQADAAQTTGEPHVPS